MSPNLAMYLQVDGSIDQILLLSLWYYWKIKIHGITILNILYTVIEGFVMPTILKSFFFFFNLIIPMKQYYYA